MFVVELSRQDLNGGRWFRIFGSQDGSEAAEVLRNNVLIDLNKEGREYRLRYVLGEGEIESLVYGFRDLKPEPDAKKKGEVRMVLIVLDYKKAEIIFRSLINKFSGEHTFTLEQIPVQLDYMIKVHHPIGVNYPIWQDMILYATGVLDGLPK
jgi:hypothetical protein